jgi:hypothetical protein
MRPPFDASAWHELVSENTIRKALATYCRAMDRIDAPLGYTVWHDDGLADYGSYFTGTGHAFVDKVCRFHRRLAAHAHHVTNMLIDVKDDRAASEAYVYVALLAASDQGHVLTTVSGRYLDRWSFRHGRWAIEQRRYVRDLAYSRQVEPEAAASTHDRSCPSYAIFDSLNPP